MQTITVSGGNLYALAATYLQDATQWVRIAQLNGLSDPMLPSAQIILLIPNPDPTQTGGIGTGVALQPYNYAATSLPAAGSFVQLDFGGDII